MKIYRKKDFGNSRTHSAPIKMLQSERVRTLGETVRHPNFSVNGMLVRKRNWMRVFAGRIAAGGPPEWCSKVSV